jgi:hypothetical protein
MLKMENVKMKKIEEFWNSKIYELNEKIKHLTLNEAAKFGLKVDDVQTKYCVCWGGKDEFIIDVHMNLYIEKKEISIDIGLICVDYLHNPTEIETRVEEIMDFDSNGWVTIDGSGFELGRLDWYRSPPSDLRTFITDIPAMTKICETAFSEYSQFYLNYFSSLPKAYAFLISNKKNKFFQKDIAKIIAYKILFFFVFLFFGWVGKMKLCKVE